MAGVSQLAAQHGSLLPLDLELVAAILPLGPAGAQDASEGGAPSDPAGKGGVAGVVGVEGQDVSLQGVLQLLLRHRLYSFEGPGSNPSWEEGKASDVDRGHRRREGERDGGVRGDVEVQAHIDVGVVGEGRAIHLLEGLTHMLKYNNKTGFNTYQ